jgi:hypothetical protein
MADDMDAAAERAAVAAHRAVKSDESRHESRSFLPLILVAAAIVSGIYLVASEGGQPAAPPTTPMPVPHVQAPGTVSPAPATPPPATPNNN